MKLILRTFLCLILLCFPSFAGEVSLAWDASPSAGVIGYKIYCGNAPGSYTRTDTLGIVTTYTVTNLAAGTWYFAATAFDASGTESDFSNEVSQVLTAVLPVTIQITTIPDPGPRVTLLLVPYISTTQVTVVWQTSANCSGIAMVSADQITWKEVKSNNLGTTEHLSVVGGLIPRTHYFYKVTGVCDGQTIESQVGSFNTK